jgi:hypothetical protein
VATWQELRSVLVDDQGLPADTRLAIAQKSRSTAARSNKPRAKTTKAKSAATSSPKQAAAELDWLFRLARVCHQPENRQRISRRQIAVAETRGQPWIGQTVERSAGRQGAGTPSGDTPKSRTSSSLEVWMV